MEAEIFFLRTYKFTLEILIVYLRKHYGTKKSLQRYFPETFEND